MENKNIGYMSKIDINGVDKVFNESCHFISKCLFIALNKSLKKGSIKIDERGSKLSYVFLDYSEFTAQMRLAPNSTTYFTAYHTIKILYE